MLALLKASKSRCAKAGRNAEQNGGQNKDRNNISTLHEKRKDSEDMARRKPVDIGMQHSHIKQPSWCREGRQEETRACGLRYLVLLSD